MLSRLANTIDRHLWISEAAYFLAEARGFEPGKALEDWLEAEIDYSEMLITAYIASLKEDNEPITMLSLQQLAFLLGIDGADKFISKAELIRAIQNATKHRTCFRLEDHSLCKDLECRWKNECRKLIAVWHHELVE